MLSRACRPSRLTVPARDLSLDDKAAQISFRGVRIQRDLRPLRDPQQFSLATPQPRQQLVELDIAGADGVDPVEPEA
jgi:hypothetical protein